MPLPIRLCVSMLAVLSASLVGITQPVHPSPRTDAITRPDEPSRARITRGHADADAAPLHRDVPYGRHPLQRFDVYAPRDAQRAPVIVLVHGGGWTRGDKAAHAVVANKVARWVPRGFIVISTNYRLQPDAAPREQAIDVARAIATAQMHAQRWGGDPHRVVLMGHSAGAHLVSLLNSDPRVARQAGARDWLGTVALDSAAFNVPAIMSAPHPRLYDVAFGDDATQWAAASPLHAHTPGAAPLLAVCASARDSACAQAQAYAAHAGRSGDRVDVLPVPLSHRAINTGLGAPGAYTTRVETFLATLDAEVAHRLARTAHPDRARKKKRAGNRPAQKRD